MSQPLWTIRFCRGDERRRLQNFLDEHWQKNHILCQSDSLLYFQHKPLGNGCLPFVVAEHQEIGEWQALLGVIPLSQYDRALVTQASELFFAIWKVLAKGPSAYALGQELMRFAENAFQSRAVAVLGIPPAVHRLYRKMGYRIGQMAHYVLCHPHKQNWSLLDVQQKKQASKHSDYQLKLVENLRQLPEIEHPFRPYKSLTYLHQRYAEHPLYRYRFYQVCRKDQTLAIFVTRVAKAHDACCLRIVDAYGLLDRLGDLSYNFAQILIDEDFEYVDCLNTGLAEDCFLHMGFQCLGAQDRVPNHFEPYDPAVVTLRWAIKTNEAGKPWVLFKGDGDQDRPNRIVQKELCAA